MLLVAFLIVGIQLIRNGAFAGQDFSFHVGCTNRMLGRPDVWFTQDVTNRPLIYWIAIDGIFATDNRAAFEFAAAVFLVFNTGALWLVHDSSRRFILSPALRLAATAFVAFLPATSIATIVFAADAMTMPPFALLCWSLLRWLEAPTDRASAGHAALAGAALVVGNFTKFTFIVLPAGVLVLALLAWRFRRANLARAAVLVGFAVLMPTIAGVWLHQKAKAALRDEPQHHTFNWHGTGEMTWRSLLGVKGSDVRIFDAPGYWDTAIENNRVTWPLLIDNNYSYPALLHLGTYTDVLDFANGGKRNIGQPRPPRQKQLSQWSVRTGLLFSLPALFAVAAAIVRIGQGLRDAERAPRFGIVIWLVLGAVWTAPLVLTLPFVHHAYGWGYWLPRLIIPGLWAGAICLFAQLDEWFSAKPVWLALLTAATALQIGLQVGSIWY